jgi:5-methyltetrahydropteroyltriglutamate--homocysteine methyltransferase
MNSSSPSARRLREEYQTIYRRGLLLQIDDPHLAMHYMLEPNPSLEETRRMGFALRGNFESHAAGLPVDRIRHHTCYGINMGPRARTIWNSSI